ncbi:hypothetical protein [Nannocystis radixulma]|uniref:Uncharacterized protein n=1 Tax=Nannocystis radixulma TaxID=2995305 RepID=A0ABT5BIZ8_9BACT|nr:hypothetical protein [Nannocystis radixulma]MDC0673570.1 hypothetical protein [Nannocystis radixulma]
MSPLPELPTPLAAVFMRVLACGIALAIALGFPGVWTASAMSRGPLGVRSVVEAAAYAMVGAALATWLVRGVVREIWSAWLGLLGGVVPASLDAPRVRWIGLALAYLAAGAVVSCDGLHVAGTGADAASDTFALFGVVSALVGLGLGLGGALPRLWWAWRGGPVEPDDDAVGRHLGWFVFLALSALALSSGFAETLPAKLDPSEIPLRRGTWERGCASTLALGQEYCPERHRYVVRARRAESMHIQWDFPRNCAVAIEADGTTHTFDAPDSTYRVDVAPERPVFVTMIGLTDEGCWFDLRARPAPEGAR